MASPLGGIPPHVDGDRLPLQSRLREAVTHPSPHAAIARMTARRRDGGRSVAEAERTLLALSVLRIFVGVIWLANLSWKLPPDFGRDQPRGLLYSFREAERWAFVEPLRDLVQNVVIPHFTLFGWLVFVVELTAGVLLTTGFLTRFGALLGTAESLTIMALVSRAPTEWFWGYAMFVVLNALPLVVVTDARLSIAHRRGSA
jgi:uncharacterized membrane protein YphA (DoxX/SURF4 family)